MVSIHFSTVVDSDMILRKWSADGASRPNGYMKGPYWGLRNVHLVKSSLFVREPSILR